MSQQPNYPEFHHIQHQALSFPLAVISPGQQTKYQYVYPINVHQQQHLAQHHQQQHIATVVANQQQLQRLHRPQTQPQLQLEQPQQMLQSTSSSLSQQTTKPKSPNTTNNHQQPIPQSSGRIVNSNNNINNSNNNISSNNLSNNDEHQLKDQTNASIKNLKEKYISHYIDGQWIIETSRPLSELKIKTSKKKNKEKKKQKQQQLQQQQQQQRQQQQQQQQQLQQQQNSQVKKAHLVNQQTTNSATTTTTTIHEANNHNISNNHSFNEDQNFNDVQKVREQMNRWSVDDVVKFIEKHEDIAQYAAKFAEDEVDGKALLLMIDKNLTLPMLCDMFKRGPAMKIEHVLSKFKLDQ